MSERFVVSKPCPDVLVVKRMIQERFRAIDPSNAQELIETVSILGPGYGCHYTVSHVKNAGERTGEYDVAIMAVFDDVKGEHPNLSVEWNTL